MKELFGALERAQKALAGARERPQGDPERGEAIERAEGQVARLRAELAELAALGPRPDGPVRPMRPQTTEPQGQARRLVGEAQEALKAGRPAAAAEKLDQAIELAPLADLLRLRARVAREMGQMDKAEQFEKRAQEAGIGDGGPPRREAGGDLARERERDRVRERLSAAEERMHAARELAADHPERAEALQRAGKELAEAREMAERFEQKLRQMRDRPDKAGGPAGPAGREPRVGPERPDGPRMGPERPDAPRMGPTGPLGRRAELRELARKADILVRSGQWERAADVLAEMTRLEPRNGVILRAQLRVLERLGRQEQAEQVRNALRELFQRRGDAPRREGDVSRREGDATPRRGGGREIPAPDRGALPEPAPEGRD